jgi:uncharacterized membrane protein
VPIFTFLHIVSMFAAVTLAHGGAWFVLWATHARDVGALRAYGRVAGRADALSFVFLASGVTFGIITAVSGGIDLTSSWLIVTYLLFIVALVAGFSSVPFADRLLAAVRDNPGDEPTPELASLMGSRWPLAYAIEAGLLVAAIIAMMVFKPSFW